MMKRARLLPLVVATLVLALVVGVLVARSVMPVSGTPEPWPAFSMRYKVLAPEQVDETRSAYQVWELDYASSREWTQTLVSDDIYPARTGSTDSFDGSTFRKFNALANTTTELPGEKDALAAPNRWLVPKSIADHQRRGFEKTSAAPDAAAALSKFETLACSRDEPKTAKICPASGLLNARTDMSVNADGIPMHVVESIASESFVSFDVESLIIAP